MDRDLYELLTINLPVGFFSGYAAGLLTMVTIEWVKELFGNGRAA